MTPNEWKAGEAATFVVESHDVGTRLDKFLAIRFPDRSRSYLCRAIEKGAVRIDGLQARASAKLKQGSTIRFTVPEPPRAGPEAEDIPLEFLFKDDWLAVINKPAGMVVHPAKGNWKGTLAGALKWHLEKETGSGTIGLSTTGGAARPGIVHRLDRDTTGVIIVARNEKAHHAIAKQFEQRTTQKTYLAITQGCPQLDRDEINLPIGIHPYQREKMAVRRDHSTSRQAITRFEVLERFSGAALVKVMPRTGRTHQIRVHMAAIGCPVLCDGLYSGRTILEPSFFGVASNSETQATPLICRQALHAFELEIRHPHTHKTVVFNAPVPADMDRVLKALRSL